MFSPVALSSTRFYDHATISMWPPLPATITSPSDAIQHGIGLLTEDRKGKGLFLEMGVKWNISFPVVRRLSRYGSDTRPLVSVGIRRG